MLRTLETFKKGVDAFNSYGLKKKSNENPESTIERSKSILGDKN